MGLDITTATASFRPNTEDRVAVHHVRGGLVIVVADGAGGLPGGARAAELNPFDADSWAELLVEADGEIERDRAAGETTAVVVAVKEHGSVVGASCGDSGALVIRKDAHIDDLTDDQHRKRRLGAGRALPIPFRRPALDGTLVIASDGLLAYARPEKIAGVVSEHDDLGPMADALVTTVRLPSGDLQDDVALAIIRPA